MSENYKSPTRNNNFPPEFHDTNWQDYSPHVPPPGAPPPSQVRGISRQMASGPQNFQQEYMHPFNPVHFPPQEYPVLPRYANPIPPGTLNGALTQVMQNLGQSLKTSYSTNQAIQMQLELLLQLKAQRKFQRGMFPSIFLYKLTYEWNRLLDSCLPHASHINMYLILNKW